VARCKLVAARKVGRQRSPAMSRASLLLSNQKAQNHGRAVGGELEMVRRPACCGRSRAADSLFARRVCSFGVAVVGVAGSSVAVVGVAVVGIAVVAGVVVVAASA